MSAGRRSTSPTSGGSCLPARTGDACPGRCKASCKRRPLIDQAQRRANVPRPVGDAGGVSNNPHPATNECRRSRRRTPPRCRPASKWLPRWSCNRRSPHKGSRPMSAREAFRAVKGLCWLPNSGLDGSHPELHCHPFRRSNAPLQAPGRVATIKGWFRPCSLTNQTKASGLS